MGLKLMQYRASLIDATLTVAKQAKGGTAVTCAMNKEGNNGSNAGPNGDQGS
jgi:nitrate/nitrite-specific signal transduction histidine kinase